MRKNGWEREGSTVATAQYSTYSTEINNFVNFVDVRIELVCCVGLRVRATSTEAEYGSRDSLE